jgi:hypothetical protein
MRKMEERVISRLNLGMYWGWGGNEKLTQMMLRVDSVFEPSITMWS